MEGKSSPRPTPQLVFGIIIIFVGVLFALDNLNILAAGEFLRYWPLALMAIGLAKLLDAESPEGRLLGGIFFGAGSILLLDTLHVLRFSVHLIWPLILVAVGLFVAWQAVMRDKAPADGESVLSATAIMGGVEKTCDTQNFRGGDITAIMGGCQIDLRQAAIKVDRAVINAFAFWGGIEIRVPEGWSVKLEGFPFMGGMTDSSRAPIIPSNQRLLVKSFVMMGGIEIRN